MHIGEKIDLLINSNSKYSKIGLANHLGKTRQAVYDIIKNPDINTRTLREISQYFSIPIIYFFEDSEEGVNNPLINKRKLYLEDRLKNLESRVSKIELSEKSTE